MFPFSFFLAPKCLNRDAESSDKEPCHNHKREAIVPFEVRNFV